MTLAQLEQTVALCSFPGLEFRCGPLGEGFFLQIKATVPDAETGGPSAQSGRKWYVSRFAIPSEVVQTALLAVLTWTEHEVREAFRYRGVAIFGPHRDVDRVAGERGNGGTVSGLHN
jgi:hypothetical protein